MPLSIAKNLKSANLRSYEPFVISYQPCDTNGVPEDLTGRVFALCFFAGGEGLGEHFGEVRTDDILWRLPGKISAELYGKQNLAWEISEYDDDGKTVVTVASLTVDVSAPYAPDHDGSPISRYINRIIRKDDPSDADTPPVFDVQRVRFESAPTSTPAPVFTSQPSFTPASGNANTIFTAFAGVASNATSLTRRWLLNGTAIGTGPTITPGAAGSLALEVTATGVGGSIVATTSAVTVSATPVVVAPASISVPTITGTPAVGQTLTASTGAWANSPASYAYQWLRSGSPISGAQTGSYALVSADSGASITVMVTATNTAGSASSTSTAVTVAVQPILATLAMSLTSFVVGTASTGTITGATTGSTIALANAPAGLTINSPARTFNYDGTGTASTATVTLTESLNGAANSPRATNIGLTIVAAPVDATAPTISRTTPSGSNPMSWSGDYPGVIPDSDYLRCRWRVDGGAWTYETDHLFTSDDFFNSEDGVAVYAWPIFDTYAFPAGALVEVQEGILRNNVTVWSNTISDTMQGIIQTAYLRGETFNYGYGFAPMSLVSPVTVQANDKLLINVSMGYNTGVSHTLVLKNASTNAVITTNLIGSTPAGGFRGYAYWADCPAGTTSVTATVTPNASTQNGAITITAVRNAKAGGPTGSYFEVRALGGNDPHYLNGPALNAGNLTVGSGEQVVIGLSTQGAGSLTAITTGATMIGENTGFSTHTMAQIANGNVSFPGNNSGGIGYSTILLCNTKWSLT